MTMVLPRLSSQNSDMLIPEEKECEEKKRGPENEDFRKLLKTIRKKRPIGKGMYGQVYRLPPSQLELKNPIETNVEQVVVKVQCRMAEGMYLNEVRILTRLDENQVQSVPKLYRLLSYKHEPLVAEEAPVYSSITIMEDCGKDLVDYMQQDLPIKKIRILFEKILYGIHEIHESGIVHRDIKPENIFIKKVKANTVVKIGDFSVSGFVTDQVMASGGTLGYAAPEQLVHAHIPRLSIFDEKRKMLTRYLSPKVDLYSLGITMMTVYALQNIFPSPESMKYRSPIQQIYMHQTVSKNQIPKKVFHILRTMTGRVNAKPKGRGYEVSSYEKILKKARKLRKKDKIIDPNVKFRQFFDLIYRLIDCDLYTRITGQGALTHPFFTP